MMWVLAGLIVDRQGTDLFRALFLFVANSRLGSEDLSLGG